MAAPLDHDEIRRRVDGYQTWYHTMELAPGIVTPGMHASDQAILALDALGFPQDLSGKRVLDVGCRDGFFSFEAERRGAVVVGIDYADPTATGFGIASEILGSDVEYHTANVYDIGPEDFGTFDVILFLGILYHLRNPLLALDGLRSMAKVGGLLFVETEVTTDPALVELATPAFEFLPRDRLAGDATNVWLPNMAGLVGALAECQFEADASKRIGNRGWAKATVVDDAELEHFRALDSSTGEFG